MARLVLRVEGFRQHQPRTQETILAGMVRVEERRSDED
jgi:hypothetical protein